MQDQSSTTQIIPLLRDTQLHILQLAGFVTACKNLLPAIRDSQRVQPEERRLPTNVGAFLCGFLRMTVAEVDLCWGALSEEVLRLEGENSILDHLMEGLWSSRDGLSRLAALDLRELSFLLWEVGSVINEKQPAAATMDIPFESCYIPGCKSKLVRKHTTRACLLTIRHGKIPVLCPLLYCNCKSIYNEYSTPRALSKSYSVQSELPP